MAIKSNAAFIRDIDKGFRKFMAQFVNLNMNAVAGYPLGGAGHLAQVNNKLVWLYMLYNEMGTLNIPARPFMQQAFDKNKEKYFKMAQSSHELIKKGDLNVNAMVKKIAVEMHNDIKRSILTGKFAPNAPATIRKKRSSKPLIDTGLALNAVTFTVRAGKGRAFGVNVHTIE